MSNSKLWRQSVIERLGGVCVRCGFDDPRAIQIDHIHGGGNKEAKAFGFKKYEQMHDHIEDYQILCANCNWIKRHERREHGYAETRRDYQEPRQKE